jgi:hypothetical protein
MPTLIPASPPIVAQGNSTFNSFLFESSVVVVVADAYCIGPSNCFKPRLPGHIGEGAVSIVLREALGCSRRSAAQP